MNSAEDKTVFITGASSGIGEACANIFAENGARLILCARRIDRLQKLADKLKKEFNTDSFIIKLDVRNQTEVQSQISKLPDNWKNIDILINNAGLARGLHKLHEGEIEDWEEMIDTNIKGLLYVTRAIVPGMIVRGRGDIVNIGSIAGHEVYPKGNVYCASKYAVDAITRGLRMDLLGTPLRVCSVDPGLVETEFSKVRFRGNFESAGKIYENMTPLSGRDIAETIYFCTTRPQHVQIAEIIVFPTDQRSATLIQRNGSSQKK